MKNRQDSIKTKKNRQDGIKREEWSRQYKKGRIEKTKLKQKNQHDIIKRKNEQDSIEWQE